MKIDSVWARLAQKCLDLLDKDHGRRVSLRPTKLWRSNGLCMIEKAIVAKLPGLLAGGYAPILPKLNSICSSV
jgi:hypothetical protein